MGEVLDSLWSPKPRRNEDKASKSAPPRHPCLCPQPSSPFHHTKDSHVSHTTLSYCDWWRTKMFTCCNMEGSHEVIFVCSAKQIHCHLVFWKTNIPQQLASILELHFFLCIWRMVWKTCILNPSDHPVLPPPTTTPPTPMGWSHWRPTVGLGASLHAQAAL